MRTRALLLAAFLASLSPAVARADSDTDRATARTLTLEGYEALDRKDYATAADRFGRAHALFPAPTVALGLAHAQVGLGKLVEALATYSRIVQTVLPASSPPAFTKAVGDARAEVVTLMPRIPKVVIDVRGWAGATVTMDGVEVPSAALGVKRPADPGAHIVRATAPGALPAEARITLLEGQVESVELTLKADPNAPKAAPAVVPPPIAPAFAPSIADAPAAPKGMSTQQVLGFASLGAGAAGLVAGAITGGLALSKNGALLEKCPNGQCYASQQASLQSDIDAMHTLATASTATLVAGGLLAATGVVLLVTAPRSQPRRDAFVKPLIGPGFVGFSGRF